LTTFDNFVGYLACELNAKKDSLFVLHDLYLALKFVSNFWEACAWTDV